MARLIVSDALAPSARCHQEWRYAKTSKKLQVRACEYARGHGRLRAVQPHMAYMDYDVDYEKWEESAGLVGYHGAI